MERQRAEQSSSQRGLGTPLSKLDLDGDGPATPDDLRQLHLFKDVEDDILADVLQMLRRTTLRPRATQAIGVRYTMRPNSSW